MQCLRVPIAEHMPEMGGCRAGTGLAVVSRLDPSRDHESRLLPWEAMVGRKSHAFPPVRMLSAVLEGKDAGCPPPSALLVPTGHVCPSPCGQVCLSPAGVQWPLPMEASAGP